MNGHPGGRGELAVNGADQRVDLTGLREQAIGKQLTRSVNANMPVVSDVIAASQQIKRGQKVMVIAESGGFTITTSGETKENSYIGENVKVVFSLFKTPAIPPTTFWIPIP